MDFEESVRVSLELINKISSKNYLKLKPEQEEVLKACVVGGKSDVLAVLPTGLGKTLCLHMLPYMHNLSDKVCIVQFMS